MRISLRNPHPASITVILLILFASLFWLGQSAYFAVSPATLSMAITADLLIVIPLLYLFLIRNTSIPRITVVPVLIAGIVLGYLSLPDTHHVYLDIFRTWVFPFIELAVVTLVILKVRRALISFKSINSSAVDFYEALKESCFQIAPGFAARAIAMEIAVFYYGFLSWKTSPPKENEFSCHRKSTGRTILLFLIFLIIVETAVFHLLLVQWSSVAAWVLTGLSIYTGIQMFGIWKSLAQRPLVISGDTLYVRYGILNELAVDMTNIESVTQLSGARDVPAGLPKLSILGDLDAYNIRISFRDPETMHRMYGMKKSVAELCLHVDDPLLFSNRLNQYITGNQD